MLRFEMDVIAADLVERTIEGVDRPLRRGRQDRRRRLPLRARLRSRGRARARRSSSTTIAARPVGVARRARRRATTGALGRFRIDATPAGDAALVQAASGSRGSFSSGAEVVAARPRTATSSTSPPRSVHEVSLLALGAFDGAAVIRVAAEADEPTSPSRSPSRSPSPTPSQEELDRTRRAGAAGPRPRGGER